MHLGPSKIPSNQGERTIEGSQESWQLLVFRNQPELALISPF